LKADGSIAREIGVPRSRETIAFPLPEKCGIFNNAGQAGHNTCVAAKTFAKVMRKERP